MYGSGKPAAHMIPNSRRSIVVLISHGHGGRNGCGPAVEVEAGDLRELRGSSSSGYGWPENTVTWWPSSVSSRAR